MKKPNKLEPETISRIRLVLYVSPTLHDAIMEGAANFADPLLNRPVAYGPFLRHLIEKDEGVSKFIGQARAKARKNQRRANDLTLLEADKRLSGKPTD